MQCLHVLSVDPHVKVEVDTRVAPLWVPLALRKPVMDLCVALEVIKLAPRKPVGLLCCCVVLEVVMLDGRKKPTRVNMCVCGEGGGELN